MNREIAVYLRKIAEHIDALNNEIEGLKIFNKLLMKDLSKADKAVVELERDKND